MLTKDETKTSDGGECTIRMVFFTVWKYEALVVCSFLWPFVVPLGSAVFGLKC